MDELVKPAKTYTEQLEMLMTRGLDVSDKEFALSVLRRVNYYRLTGYLLQYKMADDTFAQGTTFEQIYQIYEFDTELRNLIIRMLERIEISMRTKISYYLGHSVSPLAHRYGRHFRDRKIYVDFRRKLKKELKSRDRKDAVVTHHFRKYKGRFPIWVSVEYMSFGQLSVFYGNLMDEYQRSIANGISVTSGQLRSWLHCLVYVRNLCAHYSRLYGKTLTIKPKKLPPDAHLNHGNDKLFAVLYVCARLCESGSEWDRFLISIQGLADAFEGYIQISELGFTPDWFVYLKSVQRKTFTRR